MRTMKMSLLIKESAIDGVEETTKTTEISTKDRGFDQFDGGQLVKTLIEFLDEHEIDGLLSLCDAIETLGQASGGEGYANVFMAQLYYPACEITRSEIAKQPQVNKNSEAITITKEQVFRAIDRCKPKFTCNARVWSELIREVTTPVVNDTP